MRNPHNDATKYDSETSMSIVVYDEKKDDWAKIGFFDALNRAIDLRFNSSGAPDDDDGRCCPLQATEPQSPAPCRAAALDGRLSARRAPLGSAPAATRSLPQRVPAERERRERSGVSGR